MNISASLVLYHNDSIQYEKAIESFLNSTNGVLYVVDNSSYPLQCQFFLHERVVYIYNGNNLGFGRAHNKAMLDLSDSDYHLIINPDISFDSLVLPELLRFVVENPNVAAVMPKIIYPDGRLQRLCKLLPTPSYLFFRRFMPSNYIKNLINQRYELYGLTQDEPSNVPSLSGCFLFLKTDLVKQIGGFDERYFMYMEDVDLVRRLGDCSETVYYPLVKVVHHYEKGSYKSVKLLRYHITSAVRYFFKWGWFIDHVRKKRNMIILNKVNMHINQNTKL